jgi:glycine cleavage system H protein
MNNFKFTKTHEWVKEEQNEVLVGITEHAQELLGDMVFVELPEVGDTVHAGDELGVVESVKAASDFYAPISGVVTAINDRVVAEPALVNSDPLHTGWLVKLQPNNREELNSLLSADEYHNEIAEEH